MISALQKISGHSGIHAPNDIQALFIDNHEEGFAGLFDTHPPIDQRIAALVKYAHGHVDDVAASAAAPAAVPVTPSEPATTSVPVSDSNP
jgi:heat shock protein HtpX